MFPLRLDAGSWLAEPSVFRSARHTNLVPKFAANESEWRVGATRSEQEERVERRVAEGRTDVTVPSRRSERANPSPVRRRPCCKTSAQVHCRPGEPCHWPGHPARQGRPGAGDPEDPCQESSKNLAAPVRGSRRTFAPYHCVCLPSTLFAGFIEDRSRTRLPCGLTATQLRET